MGVTFPNESPEYRAARDQLLEAEIGLRRAMEAIAVARRALPPGGLVPEDYVFDGLDAEGRPDKVRLSDLFKPGRDSVLIYNMMFPRHSAEQSGGASEGETAKPPVQAQPCPSCTALVDQFDAAAFHLKPAGFDLAIVAKAPLEQLAALARDRGWKNVRLLSSAGNSFNRDYHAEDADGEQEPLMSVFHRDADGIRHFWSSELGFAEMEPGQDPRAMGLLEPLWNMIDLTPEGRPDWNVELAYDRDREEEQGRAA